MYALKLAWRNKANVLPERYSIYDTACIEADAARARVSAGVKVTVIEVDE
jgi:hypothetical protein